MRAFIAMPFDKSFDLYWEIIKDTCKDFNIDFFRVDKNLSYERNIDIAIRKEIEKSDFVISVLTGDKIKSVPNANVAFEVGYAQGIGKETILLAESIDCLPFDFKQQRTGFYEENPERIKEYLKEEINLLKAMLSKKYIEDIKSFFVEIERCLNIVLPSDYRFFKYSRGVYANELWYGISYFKNDNFLKYAVSIGEDINKIKMHVWFNDKHYIQQQKEYAKKRYEDIRRSLGYDVNFNFYRHDQRDDNKENVKKNIKDRNFINEVLLFEKQNFSTSEALKIALRLKDYVQSLQPLFATFAEEHDIEKFQN